MQQLQQVLFLALLRVCSWLPITFARGFGRLVSALLWHFKSRNRHVTEINLKHCFPHLSDTAQRELARKSYLSIGEGVAEMGAVWLKPAQKILGLVESVENEVLFRNSIAQNKGTIVLIPHLGNWEVIGLYLAAVHDTTSLYELSGRERLDSFISKVRSRNGATLVPTNQKGIGRLLRNLKKGHVTAILPDQLPRERSSGEYAPFFGHQVLTMTLVSNLIQRTGAVVIFGFALRTERGFKIIFRKADDNLCSGSQLESLATLNRGIEQCIECCPSQYSWEYKRFRDRPKAKTSIYDRS